MVREQLEARGIRDQATLEAMGIVPREAFVPAELQRRAYDDCALAIGHGQTISQPYMVAAMTAALGLADHGWPWTGHPPVVLDIGTGSGYQAAVLAQTGARVTTVERDADLAATAQERLKGLRYEVDSVVADGSEGYAEAAPYVGIIVGAASPTIPPPLVDQLAEGGRLVIPVGPRDAQRLTIAEKRGAQIDSRTMDACVFVPLVGTHGYSG